LTILKVGVDEQGRLGSHHSRDYRSPNLLGVWVVKGPHQVNGVLLEMLSTIHFLVRSPEVTALMQSIEAEIA